MERKLSIFDQENKQNTNIQIVWSIRKSSCKCL